MKHRLHPRIVKLIGLLIFALMLLITINEFRSNPLGEYVQYYDRVLPRPQFDAEGKTHYCGQIALSPIEYFQRLLSHSPQFRCFDTQDEVNNWFKSTGQPPF